MFDSPVRLVLTGAPGSGKSSILNLLAADPAHHWLVFLPEMARELLKSDPSYRSRWDEFHVELYKRQCQREASLENRPFVTDRGTVDAFGFHPEGLKKVGSDLAAEYRRYSHVLLLETSAHLGSLYYQTDEIRTESASDALAIEQALLRAWGGHPNLIRMPATADFDAKYDAVSTKLSQLRSENELVRQT